MFKSSLFFEDEWSLAIIKKPISDLFSKDFFDDLKLIQNPRNSFLADPYIVSEAPLTILCEYYSFSGKIGRIEEVNLEENGDIRARSVFLKEAWHLSFPTKLEETILVESATAGGVYLYDASGKNGSCIIIESLLDPVIIKIGEAYLLIANSMIDSELQLYTASSLNSKWSKLESWKFVGDNLDARSAGVPFIKEGKLLRPCQIGKDADYGSGISINELNIDFENRVFEQKEIMRIDPSSIGRPEYKGLHTISSKQNWTIIDLKSRRFVLLNPLYKIWRRLLNGIRG